MVKQALERGLYVCNLARNEQKMKELDDTFSKELSENYIPKYYVVREELPYSEVNKKCDFKALEKENILDETINLSIISKLLNLKLITEKQYYVLKEKIKNFY